MGTLRSENSFLKQPNSPTDSVSESNIVSDFDQNPSNLLFQAVKFEPDVEVQSPDNSIWESLFSDQIDSGADFMISSPKRMPNFNNSYSYFQSINGQSLLGCSPPSCNSSQRAFSRTHKGKSPSPLHKVYQPSQFVKPESLALPDMDEFLDDFHRDSFGSYSASKLPSCSPESFEIPTMVPAMLDCLPMLNSTFCGTENNVDPAALQIKQESGDLYQMQEQDSGLQLVHFLLACAEAVAKEEYMSARRYLQLLNQVVSPLGDSMQRVASCFTNALTFRLDFSTTTSVLKSFSSSPPTSIENLKIYQILYQACPYIKFAHFTANQAIFEAFEDEERVHVIDLDIHQGYQWPAFIQALAARPGGAPFLRITGIGTPPEYVRETGRRLTELAHSLHVPFEFHPVGEQLENIQSHMLQRRIGEALAVNSVNCLHRVSGSVMGNLIGMIRDQAPNIVTLVEQEANHNGQYFLGRFLEALHYYSAIFDSLDATFPSDSPERAKVEQYIFAPEIRNIVACEGAERVERHERLEKWRKLMEGKGFTSVAFGANAVTQSKILLGLYPCDGYRLTEDKGCLLLGWQDRAIIAASAWRG